MLSLWMGTRLNSLCVLVAVKRWSPNAQQQGSCPALRGSIGRNLGGLALLVAACRPNKFGPTVVVQWPQRSALRRAELARPLRWPAPAPSCMTACRTNPALPGKMPHRAPCGCRSEARQARCGGRSERGGPATRRDRRRDDSCRTCASFRRVSFAGCAVVRPHAQRPR